MEVIIRKNGLKNTKQMYEVGVKIRDNKYIPIHSNLDNMRTVNAIKGNVETLIKEIYIEK